MAERLQRLTTMRIAVLVAVAVLCVSLATSPVGAAPCAPGTLQDYIDLSTTGCTIAAVTFSDFTQLSPPAGATAISPAAITVTPLVDPSNPGLLLTLDVVVTAAEFLDAFFGFQVAGGLAGASLAMGGASATGDGAVTVIEDLCQGAAFSGLACAGDPATQIVFATELASDTTEAIAFPAVALLGVLTDIGVDGGPTGDAELATVTLRFATGSAAVPEPPALVLLPVVLLAVWLGRRLPLARGHRRERLPSRS